MNVIDVTAPKTDATSTIGGTTTMTMDAVMTTDVGVTVNGMPTSYNLHITQGSSLGTGVNVPRHMNACAPAFNVRRLKNICKQLLR